MLQVAVCLCRPANTSLRIHSLFALIYIRFQVIFRSTAILTSRRYPQLCKLVELLLLLDDAPLGYVPQLHSEAETQLDMRAQSTNRVRPLPCHPAEVQRIQIAPFPKAWSGAAATAQFQPLSVGWSGYSGACSWSHAPLLVSGSPLL